MGRIADALHRAESERRALRANNEWGGSAATAVCEPPRAEAPSVPLVPLPTSSEELASGSSIVDGLSESLVPFHERSSLVTEQYRSLRTRLLSQNPNYEHRVLAITSAVPKEGKSVTTLNLAAVIAEIRHLKVLVVDGDFRRSTLATMLNQPDSPGLADVLAGRAEYEQAIQRTPIPNLSFIPAGHTHDRSPAELLTAAMAKPLFKRMQNEFHYTLVDTPPATTVTDVGIIGQLCSAVIMVVRLNYTDEHSAKRAARLLHANNIPVTGCLLVGQNVRSNRYGYGYSSYYYRYHNYYRFARKTDGTK